MKRLKRHKPFLSSLLREANANRRKVMLDHAHKDQINAISEMALNLLRQKVPIHRELMARLRVQKRALREIGHRKNSLKRRKNHLINQKGSGFWKGLNSLYKRCCRKGKF